MTKLFVAIYEPNDFQDKQLLSKAYKKLKTEYQDVIACADSGTGSVEYLIDGGIVSTNFLDHTKICPPPITLVHSSREGLEQLARKLDMPFPTRKNLPRLNFNYSDHLNGRSFCLDIHKRD